MVQGYHIYEDVWDAAIGEDLSCQRKVDNYTNLFAIAIVKEGEGVGHVPRKISTETFIGINFHQIVMSHKKAKISTPHNKPALYGIRTYKYTFQCPLDRSAYNNVY